MSDKNDLSHYIPKRLDDTGKFLFWDKDVAFIALAGVLLGMAIHILYWLTGFPELEELPNSHFREFNG